MKERHVPIRLCLGCDSNDRRDRLERFAVVDGRLAWSQGLGSRGRGGYLHRRQECLDRFVSRKPFLRSLRVSVDRVERARLVALTAAAG